MAYGRGHASFTIDALKLAKDSLPAAVTEPPPVFPELLNSPHPLIENSTNDYKLKVKQNFYSNFRNLHDSTKEEQEKSFLLNKWKEEWLLLPRELKLTARTTTNASKIKPNLPKKKLPIKKKTSVNIDLNTYEEGGPAEDDDEQGGEKNDENLDIDENDDEGKSKDTEKKKLADAENEMDADMVEEEEEDMDEDEAADYIESYFDPGDRDDDDLDDDGGDGRD